MGFIEPRVGSQWWGGKAWWATEEVYEKPRPWRIPLGPLVLKGFVEL